MNRTWSAASYTSRWVKIPGSGGPARDAPLADEFHFGIINGRDKEPERFYGVSGKIDY
jgi:hypothetical protein